MKLRISASWATAVADQITCMWAEEVLSQCPRREANAASLRDAETFRSQFRILLSGLKWPGALVQQRIARRHLWPARICLACFFWRAYQVGASDWPGRGCHLSLSCTLAGDVIQLLHEESHRTIARATGGGH
jgi:hypothetical protein